MVCCKCCPKPGLAVKRVLSRKRFPVYITLCERVAPFRKKKKIKKSSPLFFFSRVYVFMVVRFFTLVFIARSKPTRNKGFGVELTTYTHYEQIRIFLFITSLVKREILASEIFENRDWKKDVFQIRRPNILFSCSWRKRGKNEGTRAKIERSGVFSTLKICSFNTIRACKRILPPLPLYYTIIDTLVHFVTVHSLA